MKFFGCCTIQRDVLCVVERMRYGVQRKCNEVLVRVQKVMSRSMYVEKVKQKIFLCMSDVHMSAHIRQEIMTSCDVLI